MKINSTKKKTRTGTLEAFEGPDGARRYRGRLRLADGSKSGRLELPERLDEAGARAYLASLQAAEDATGQVLAAKRDRAREIAAASRSPSVGETCDTWHARFLLSAARADYEDANKMAAGRWGKWISPHIGALAITGVTSDEIELVRDGLDSAIRAKVLAPKTAQNVWSVLTTAFKAARNAKQRDLRVRTDNPCTDVLPPEDGPSKRKHWVWPNEAAALFSCEAVPLEWRRTYAVAAYTGLRPEESAELRWSDVDFAQGEIHVRRAWGWNTKRVELPKTQAGIRSLPIEPELLPILKAMGEGAAPEALVVPLVRKLGKHKLAPMFRKHLQAAGGCRPAIFVESPTHEMVGFRALRDTYCTWSAIDGRPIERVQTRAGHENMSTTRGYYREVEDRPQLRGSAFPSLTCLAGPAIGPNCGQALGTIVEAPGIEPGSESNCLTVSPCAADSLYRLVGRLSACYPHG